MAEKTKTPTAPPMGRYWFVITALTMICSVYKQTFSWYVSKKGRVWLAFKGHDMTLYSTSAECVSPYTDRGSLDTLSVLLAEHLPKVLQIAPPVTSWHGGSHTPEEVARAWLACEELWARLVQELPDEYAPIPHIIHPEDDVAGPLYSPDDPDAQD